MCLGGEGVNASLGSIQGDIIKVDFAGYLSIKSWEEEFEREIFWQKYFQKSILENHKHMTLFILLVIKKNILNSV